MNERYVMVEKLAEGGKAAARLDPRKPSEVTGRALPRAAVDRGVRASRPPRGSVDLELGRISLTHAGMAHG